MKVDGAANVTIDDTLTLTGGTPILLDDTVTATDAGNISITVWEIKGQTDAGIVVEGGQEGAAAAVQQNIDYIIKAAPDKSSQQVFSDYNTGDTMHSGEQTIKVTVSQSFTALWTKA